MTPVVPPLHEGATLITFARDQPQYMQLPASVDGEGTVMTEWELSAEELSRLLNGGRLRLWVMYTDVAQGKPLTPMLLEAIDATSDESEESQSSSPARTVHDKGDDV